MNKDNINCKCGKIFDSIGFKKHFKNCTSFKEKFEKFDFKINMLLKEYISNVEDIFFIKFILKFYIHIIDKTMKNKNENSEKGITLNEKCNENDIKYKENYKNYYIKEEKNDDKFVNFSKRDIMKKDNLNKEQYKNTKNNVEYHKDINDISNISNINQLAMENEIKDNNIFSIFEKDMNNIKNLDIFDNTKSKSASSLSNKNNNFSRTIKGN